MAPTKDQLLARRQHAEAMLDAALAALDDIERQPAPSRYDVIMARRELRIAQDNFDMADDAVFPPRRIA